MRRGVVKTWSELLVVGGFVKTRSGLLVFLVVERGSGLVVACGAVLAPLAPPSPDTAKQISGAGVIIPATRALKAPRGTALVAELSALLEAALRLASVAPSAAKAR